MSKSAMAELVVNGATGASVLAVGAVALAFMYKAMHSPVNRPEPEFDMGFGPEFDDEDADDEVDDLDGDAWDRGHDRWVADERDAL